MAREEEGRWAVVNKNLDTGESVQYMETHQDWVAKLFSERANKSYAKDGRNYESSVVKLV